MGYAHLFACTNVEKSTLHIPLSANSVSRKKASGKASKVFNCFFFKEQVFKYQGVKEFHLLVHMGCYCKMMVFNLLKCHICYYQPQKGKLLRETNGKQGKLIMLLSTFDYTKRVKHQKMPSLVPLCTPLGCSSLIYIKS